MQLALCELDVPVAVLVPNEAINRGGGVVEAIVGERLFDLRFGVLQPADDPAVDEGELRGLRKVLALHIHEDEARRIPQLVAEVAVALAAVEVEVERDRESRERGKGKAH